MILLFGLAMARVPAGEWRPLDGGRYPVSCMDGDSPRWCRVQAEVGCKMSQLQQALSHPEGYMDIFPRIQKASWVGEGIAHIQLSMPLLFKSRDYVSVFKVEKSRDEWLLNFYPSERSIISPERDVVRLSDYSGAWSLKAISADRILVTFFWNSDYELPTSVWSRDGVRLKQGVEIMYQIDRYCQP